MNVLTVDIPITIKAMMNTMCNLCETFVSSDIPVLILYEPHYSHDRAWISKISSYVDVFMTSISFYWQEIGG